MNDYRFEVEREQLFRKGGVDTMYDALYRKSDGFQLSVVSRDYQLVTHAEAVNFIDDQLKTAGIKSVEHEIDLTNDGKRLKYEVRFPDYQFKVPGDTSLVEPTMKTWNSLDKSRSFILEFGNLRLVCTNGMTVGKNILQVSQIHYANQIKFAEIGPMIPQAIEMAMHDYNAHAQRLLNEEAHKYMKTLLESFPVLFLNMAASELEHFFNFTYKLVGGIEKPVSYKKVAAMTAYELWQILTMIVSHRVVSITKRQKLARDVASLMRTS